MLAIFQVQTRRIRSRETSELLPFRQQWWAARLMREFRERFKRKAGRFAAIQAVIRRRRNLPPRNSFRVVVRRPSSQEVLFAA